VAFISFRARGAVGLYELSDNADPPLRAARQSPPRGELGPLPRTAGCTRPDCSARAGTGVHALGRPRSPLPATPREAGDAHKIPDRRRRVKRIAPKFWRISSAVRRTTGPSVAPRWSAAKPSSVRSSERSAAPAMCMHHCIGLHQMLGHYQRAGGHVRSDFDDTRRLQTG